jgi:hypothetical protein
MISSVENNILRRFRSFQNFRRHFTRRPGEEEKRNGGNPSGIPRNGKPPGQLSYVLYATAVGSILRMKKANAPESQVHFAAVFSFSCLVFDLSFAFP